MKFRFHKILQYIRCNLGYNSYSDQTASTNPMTPFIAIGYKVIYQTRMMSMGTKNTFE